MLQNLMSCLYVCAQFSLSNLEHVKKLVGVDAYFFTVFILIYVDVRACAPAYDTDILLDFASQN